MSLVTILPIIHLIGLALAVGAATLKLTLVFKYRSDSSFIPTFLKITRIITRQIIIGMILLALTGIIWLIIGYGFSTLLIIKIVIFGLIFILGPIIDNAIEPKLHKFAPAANEKPSPEFIRAQNQHLVLELIATLLFYIIVIMWMLR